MSGAFFVTRVQISARVWVGSLQIFAIVTALFISRSANKNPIAGL